VIARKAAMSAVDHKKAITMATDCDDAEFEPAHASSPTDEILTELQLYGHRPFQDDPDPRPRPKPETIGGAVADVFDALVATLGDTRLEPDLEDLLWSTVNLFHRAAERVQRELDDNKDAQKRCQKGAGWLGDPSRTLQQIGAQLEAMHQRAPRGGVRWSPSSVKICWIALCGADSSRRQRHKRTADDGIGALCKERRFRRGGRLAALRRSLAAPSEARQS
jgi:hypothetical protein